MTWGTGQPGSIDRREAIREIILGLLLFVVLGAGMWRVWPWLLPVRVVEGPMVQRAADAGVSLVWYTTRPALCELRVRTDDARERVVSIEASGTRHVARLPAFEPGSLVPYTLRTSGQRIEAAFRMSRAGGQPMRFVVFGDSGKGTREQYLLAQQIAKSDPDFLVHTGDIIYSGGERRHYANRFFAPYRSLLASVPFWPCIGNHDTHEIETYLEIFEIPQNGPPQLPPERHYWFDSGDARFVVIDSDADEAVLRDSVAPWLAEALDSAGSRWKFVVFHHPPYTAGSHKPDERIRRTLVPVMDAGGADMVFNGHDHMYERTVPLVGGRVASENERGIVYIVTGAGGARLYNLRPPAERPDYFAKLVNDVHSFTEIVVDGDALSLRQISIDGRELDAFTMARKRG